MGHYCKICGRTRANEKFSGKGHKNHVCKDCSGKAGRKAKEKILNEDSQAVDDLDLLFGALVESEQSPFDDSWLYEREHDISRSDDEDEEADEDEDGFEVDGSDDDYDEDEFEIVELEQDDAETEESDEAYEDIPF